MEVDCLLTVDCVRAIVPRRPTGAYEALELRDGDASVYLGKGVSNAVNNVKDHLEEALVGLPVDEQRVIDEVMIELDGTPTSPNSVPTPCWGPQWLASTQERPTTNSRFGNTWAGLQAG